jgi:hypothetical protein
MAFLGPYLVACGLLVIAGLAKAVRPGDTARAVRQVIGRGPGVGPWSVAVRLLALAEAALGALALVLPQRAEALAVAGSYLGFTCFVGLARAVGGSLATCGCFGSPDTPPTITHAALTLVLAVGATGMAEVAPSGTMASVLGGQVAAGVPVVAASAVAGLLAWAVLSPLSRLGALRAVTPR